MKKIFPSANLVGLYKNKKHLIESMWQILKNGYPARKLKVIGVTGTDGKTTTSHLIYEMLLASGKKVALISTLGAFIGDSKLNTGFHVTTPDAKFLQPLIKKIVDSNIEFLVLEATSHGLDQHRVIGCNFLVGVVTNISHEHLDYHKTMDKYKASKAKLLRGVKWTVLNGDDASYEYFKKIAQKSIVVTYRKGNIRPVSRALRGSYNQYNIAAAQAVVKLFGIKPKVVKKVVAEFPGVAGRFQEIDLGQNFQAIIDFAHTPNALKAVLEELKKGKEKSVKLIVVFGCAGLRDKTKRSIMGDIAVQLADKVIITAEDPRTENLEDIYKEIISGLSHEQMKKVIRIDDRKKAIVLGVKNAKAKDILLIAGKGHEKSMCIGKIEHPWSDEKTLKNAIKLQNNPQ